MNQDKQGRWSSGPYKNNYNDIPTNNPGIPDDKDCQEFRDQEVWAREQMKRGFLGALKFLNPDAFLRRPDGYYDVDFNRWYQREVLDKRIKSSKIAG